MPPRQGIEARDIWQRDRTTYVANRADAAFRGAIRHNAAARLVM